MLTPEIIRIIKGRLAKALVLGEIDLDEYQNALAVINDNSGSDVNADY